MAKFTLTSGGVEYAFDTQGAVSTNDKPIGRWSTNSKNEILVTKDAGGTLTIPVDWKFNDANQLLLLQEDQEILNFAAEPPEFSLRQNVLVVQPGDSVSFKFELYPQWGLDKLNNLIVQIGGNASVLEGYVDDSSSRFIFWFKDEKSETDGEYMLVFNGAWEQDKSNKDSVQLVFKGKVSGTKLQFTFKLTKAESYVDPAHNHLVLEYDTSKGRRRVELRGSLRISEKLGLSFTISEQRGIEGGVLVEQREIKVATTFEFNRLSGRLELYVGTRRTAKSQKLTIGGAFEVRLGAAGLDLSFAYEQERPLGGAPAVAVVSVVVGGVFTWEKGKVNFSFEQAGKRKKLDVTGQVELTDAVALQFGVTFQTDQGLKRVKGFLGISW